MDGWGEGGTDGGVVGVGEEGESEEGVRDGPILIIMQYPRVL